uniref:C2H2-type domain-containing protein n=1 Tax=Hucho hucho TaxID=62062 RepID=A0A4W5QRL5_9TELE
MDSQQTGVLTNGGSDDRSVAQSLKRSGTVPEIHEEPVDSLILSCPPVWRHPTNQNPQSQSTPPSHGTTISTSPPPHLSPLPLFPSSPPADPGTWTPWTLWTSSPSSGPRRVLYCPLCPRIFYYMSDLERHSITHSQNKPHVCLQCGKAFKRSSHLQRHKHIHTGKRNFVCPICSKRFR